MSAREDGKRVAALVAAVDRLASGQATTIAELSMQVFGWDAERVFHAVDAALVAGLIARNEPKPAAKA